MLDALHRLEVKWPQYFGVWVCLTDGGINFLACSSRFSSFLDPPEETSRSSFRNVGGGGAFGLARWKTSNSSVTIMTILDLQNQGRWNAIAWGLIQLWGGTKSWYKLRFF